MRNRMQHPKVKKKVIITNAVRILNPIYYCHLHNSPFLVSVLRKTNNNNKSLFFCVLNSVKDNTRQTTEEKQISQDV
jgi:hypothetical protein